LKTRIQLKVRAAAKQTTFTGRLGAAWKLDVAAPPVDGRANEEIIRFIAEILGTQRSAVRIVSGAGGPRKILEIIGIDEGTLARVILESHGSRTHTGSAPQRKG
jgi:uncharacterized protein (TIGR00251 family)